MENISKEITIPANTSSKIKIVDMLSSVLLHSYVLCLKTFNCMWNIKMHYKDQIVLKEQFKELEKAVNEITQRIRELGYEVQRDFDQIRRLSEINFDRSETAEVLEDIAQTNEFINKYIDKNLDLILDARDLETFELLTKRKIVHERNANMIQNIIPNNV